MRNFRNFFTRKRVRLVLLSLALLLSGFALYLDITVRMQFEGKRWAMPARVYARPLELYAGMKLRPEQLALELAMLDYRVAADPREPGSYRRQGDEFIIVTRPFTFWDEGPARPALAGGLRWHAYGHTDPSRYRQAGDAGAAGPGVDRRHLSGA